MKKIYLVLFALLTLAFNGCSSNSVDSPEEAAKVFYENLVNGDMQIAQELSMPGTNLMALRNYNGYLREPEKVKIRTKLMKESGNMAFVEIYFRDDQKRPSKVVMMKSGGGWKFQALAGYAR